MNYLMLCLTRITRMFRYVSTHDAIWVSDGTAEGTQAQISILRDNAEDSGIDHLRVQNGRMLFTFSQPGTGRELWVSDGTESGTHIVKDVNPGPAQD